MPLTSSMENYLKTVFILYRKQGYARCVDISEYMGVTMPSVSRAVKELIKADYLMKEANGTLSLTLAGEKIAQNVYERHCFFTEQLIAASVDPETVEVDACRIEHVISNESFERLKEAVFRKQENEISARSKEIKDKPTE